MKQTISIFLAFVFIMIIGFFLIGFTSSVPVPAAGTAAANQSANLTKVVDVASAGINGTMLILIGSAAFSALAFMMYSFKKKR